MKSRIRPHYVIIAGLNALSLIAAIILTAVGGSMAASQSWNSAAAKWDSDGESSQISCYFSDDAGFTTDGLGGARAAMLTSLKNISITAEDGAELIPDAYSVSAGTATVRSDTTTGRAEAELTAVGGKFFMFRDFQLLDGAYFSENDLMQDGAVIDRRLAWALYGSVNVSGMNIYINGVKFYISGVIEDPQGKYEKKTAGEAPRAYISYSGASQLNLASAEMSADLYGGDTALKKITCYECIMPDPVENYAYNAVNGYFSNLYPDSFAAVSSGTRFSPSVRAKAFKSRWKYAVRDDGIKYPYWENASRIVEYKLSAVYFWRRIALIAPAITAAWLVFLLCRTLKRHGKSLISAIIEKIKKIMYEHKQKKANI